nr:hypothetical protein [Tanacetum cinerariifolium]
IKCANLIRRSTMTQMVSCSFDVLVDDSLILSRFLSKRSNLKAGRISHRFWATSAALGIKSIWISTWRTKGRSVPGQMTYLVADSTLNSTRSCVMQGEFPTQGKVSSIPTVFCWGGSIRPEGFWPSILLLTIINVAVAIVVARHALLPNPLASGLCWAYAFHQDKESSVRVPVANVTLCSLVQLLRENTDSVRSNQWMSPIAPSVPLK